MKNLIRRFFAVFGLDVSRVPKGRPFKFYLDYPVSPQPRWGHGRPPQPQIDQALQASKDVFIGLLKEFQSLKPEFAAIPADATSAVGAHWNNVWFSTLDAAALMGFLYLRKPRLYLEIGSGNSTRFARHTVALKKLDTRIVSIDPRPRAEINALCDEIIRQPLETVDLSVFDQLDSGDILFFDGSHRVFTNSDVTTFFFDILPRLKPGVIVHIHDIFWPDDYPRQWNQRLYSEQYLLGAMMLDNPRIRVLMPNYFVTRDPVTAPFVKELGIPLRYSHVDFPGLSFWFEML